jgi:serine/threonine protein kinase
MNQETLFHEALARPAGERAAFLDAACAGQPQLRAAVEALLAAHEASGSFLKGPAAAPSDATGPYGPQAGGQPRLPATTDHHPASGSGTVVGGRYTLEEKLGEGGMGEVWVAKQTEPVKRRVALKLIKAGMDSKAVLVRFEQERQALALMDHPNIARVLDGGMTPDGRPFFVMELVNGLPLTRFCDELKLTPKERLELFVPICQAVQHAHQKGIIHRDLKPSNVLVTVIDGRGVPKIIDFGVAKATAGKLTDESLSTHFGAVVGTLEYMAPEQAGYAGADIDTRADIYSLGVILYELLTGLRPIDAKRLRKAALTEMIRILHEEEPSKPSTRLSTDESLPSLAALRQIEPKKLMALLRGELDWVVMKCLEKQRDRRYETASGLARDVQRYLADEPVEARPPSASYRLGKFLKRHRGPVLAAGVVLLALVLGMAGTLWGLLRAEERRRDAEQAQAEESRQRALAQQKEQEANTEKEKALKAAAAEKAALAQTQRRLQQIEKGGNLLASLLTGINPRNEEKGGPTLYQQLRERASKAADQLDADSVGDPQAVARLQSVLGEALYELGDSTRAIAVLEKACATRARELGDDHPDTLTSRNSLGCAYEIAGKFDLAIQLFQSALKAQEARHGAVHPETMAYRNNLARAYQSAGAADKAIALFERNLQVCEARLGNDHLHTLDARSNLALAYEKSGQLRRAIPLLERTLKAREEKLGNDHVNTMTSRNNLACAYQEAGKLDEALGLFERNLALEKTKFGDDHPATLACRNNLALAYEAAGKLDRAIPLLEATLKTREAKLGQDHPDALAALNNLGTAYLTAGQLQKAIPLLERALRATQAKLGDDHPDTIESRNNLAMAYQASGELDRALPLFEQAAHSLEKLRFQDQNAPTILHNATAAYEAAKQFDKAEMWHRKWLPILRQQAGEVSPAYAFHLGALGLDQLHQQKWHDAEVSFRECLAIRTKGAPDNWVTFHVQALLGGSLLGQKKYAEAEPLLLAAYDGLKQRQKAIPPADLSCFADATKSLVQLYEATGKKDAAEHWRKVLAGHQSAPKPPEKKP